MPGLILYKNILIFVIRLHILTILIMIQNNAECFLLLMFGENIFR
jgi:hypothetical protein